MCHIPASTADVSGFGASATLVEGMASFTRPRVVDFILLSEISHFINREMKFRIKNMQNKHGNQVLFSLSEKQIQREHLPDG
jgi:hypothetical protein